MASNRRASGWTRRLGTGLGLLGAAWLLSACDPLPVLELTVTTTTDGNDADPGDGICEMTDGLGDCSLRAAVDEANATPDHDTTILVPAGTYDTSGGTNDDNNSDGDLDIDTTTALTIIGQGTGAIIDSGGDDGGIDVLAGNVTIRNLAIRGSAGRALLTRTGATLSVDRSAIHDNPGGGIMTAPDSNTVVSNTTISGNEPGIFNNGNIVLAYATVTDNQVGGLLGPGSATATGTIVADQEGLLDCAAPITSLGHNIDSDNSCGLDQPSDQPDVPSAALAALTADPVPFHSPQPGSPAEGVIAPADPSCAGQTDQTGTPRPQGTGCEAGAIEVDDLPPTFTVDTATDATDANVGDGTCATTSGGCSLRAAIQEANAAPGANIITIEPGLGPIVLSIPGVNEQQSAAGDLDIRAPLTVEGNGATIDAAGLDRALHAHSTTVDLRDLTITGGHATSGVGPGTPRPAGHGGGYLAYQSTTTLHNVTLTDNTALGAGAGAYFNGGAATIEGSAITGNDVTPNTDTLVPAGGGIAAAAATGDPPVQLDIASTTIQGNSALVTVSDVIIPGCWPGSLDSGHGGGLQVERGDVTISDSTIDENTAGNQGGGIALTDGTFAITGGTVADNEAIGDYANYADEDCYGTRTLGEGGGLRLEGVGTTITGTTITRNHAAHGGGIDVQGGTFTLDSSTVSDNLADGTVRYIGDGWRTTSSHGTGGGLRLIGAEASVLGSDVTGNDTTRQGGGVHHTTSALTISNTSIRDNSAVGSVIRSTGECGFGYSGTEALGEGGGLYSTATLSINDSSVNGNASLLTGGGIRSSGPLTLAASTILGNVSSGQTSLYNPCTGTTTTTDFGTGGGLWHSGSSLVATNSTIASNEARVSGGGGWNQGAAANGTFLTVTENTGGGFAGPGARTLRGSIVANQATGTNCSGPTTSGGRNISSDASCGFSAIYSDLSNVNPNLTGPVTDGLQTFYPPAPLSPARESVPVGTTGLCDGSIPSDQRGIARPQGGACDRGSVEQ